jgi:anti-anti-sigma regulatory factor
MLSPLSLPSELTIYTVADFHARCISQVLAPGDRALADARSGLDASAVQEVDAAGLQSLVSLANALKGCGASLLLNTPSDALRQACAALGMTALLGGAHVAGESS